MNTDYTGRSASSSGQEFLDRYREMAEDKVRESEAEEWCEGLNKLTEVK